MSSRERRAILVGGGLAVVLSCAFGTWWLIPSGEPPVERVRVTVMHDGATAAEIDRTIAAPLAAALTELERSEVTIESSEGVAEAVVELRANGMALERVRDRVARMTLPESAHATITRAPRGRAVRWLVRGAHAADRQWMLRAQVEAAARQEVRTCAREEEVHVIVDAQRAAAHGTDAVAVADALRRENVERPGGYIEHGADEYLVRGRGVLDSVASLGEAVIAMRDSGVPVRVGDVATVARAPAPDGCACLIDGEPCASGVVIAGEGPVREALSGEEGRWPAGETLTWVDAALTFAAPAGTSREDLSRLGQSLAGAARVEGVREIALEVSPEAAHGDLTVLLVLARDTDASAILADVRAAVARTPGVVLLPPEDGPEVEIAGDDLDVLAETAATVRRTLGEVARLVPLGVERAPELRVTLDRARAAALGVTAAALARAVRIAAGGEIATHHREGAREYPVRVRTEVALDELRVGIPSGSVPIHDVATITRELAPPVLYRCGTQRCVRLAIDGDPDALEQAEERLSSIEIPPGVTLRWREG